MRRTGTAVRGRRLAAAMAVAALAVGAAAGPAAGVDSIREQQWHLDAMHAPDMWKTSTGQGITVGLVDTGVQGDAPDLQGQLVEGTDLSGLANSGGVLHDTVGHGTGMATLIAGSGKGLGGKGAYGLAPGAKILPVKVNAGSEFTAAAADYATQLANGITYAADHGAKVINLSQGIHASLVRPADLEALKAAVQHANAKGSLVVASVGNEGDKGNPVNYPGALPGVVGVAATDRDGKTTAESERGAQVALAAPGADMYHACTGPSGYCKTHGTSDAAAVVSASAALLWAAHPDWTNNQVLRVLINTASNPKERSDFIGYGAVRPRIALSDPGDPGAAGEFPLKAAAAADPTPGAGTGGASAPATGQGQGQTPGSSQPAAASDSDSGSSMPLILGGAAVAVVLLVIVVVVLAKRNRPAAAGSAPVPPAAPYGAQPPYQGPGFPAQQPPAGPYGQQPPAPGGYPPPQGQTPPPPGGNPYAR
ncbi:type VII secretion-associated serine protease mycosin [Streptomyces sp. NRRL B-24484]|uniref:type VII secretion-associated serine protease mycosin n=1 Tax=Streptomyces sp. NRRL B-24484 TaxID=1463833 RepID=UPI0004C16FAE|nr:type VII secretion-associated serine protease mycosin [Streptomyces sp. NRRL B-24484]